MKNLIVKNKRWQALFLCLAMIAATLSGVCVMPVNAEPIDAENAASLGGVDYPTLQAAITAVDGVADQTITLLKDVSENLTSEGKSYTLDMQGHKITPANAETTIYTINGGTVTLKSTGDKKGTLTGANISGNGGAISASGGAVITINNVDITDNKAKNGGGIYLSGSELTLENSAVSKNAMTDNYCFGGGIYAIESSIMTLNKGCSITENACEYGENSHGSGTAIHIENSTLKTGEITEGDGYIEITGNKSGEGGGPSETALIAKNCEITLNRVKISNNVSVDGRGALEVRQSSFTATDCEFNNNQAKDGALSFTNTDALDKKIALNNCVISENKSTSGATVYLANGIIDFDKCRIENNSVGSNVSPEDMASGALELYCGSEDYPTGATLKSTVITGNTGYKSGGIAVNNFTDVYSPGSQPQAISLTADENCAIYGNTALYKGDGYSGDGYANDLWIPNNIKGISIPAASSMNDPNSHADFSQLKWVDNNDTAYDGALSNETLTGRTLYCLTARDPNRNIAQTGDKKYSSITAAIANAQTEDGVKKIKLIAGEDNWGTTIAEDVKISEKIEIDLNGCTVNGKTGNAFNISNDSLTLINTNESSRSSVGEINNEAVLHIKNGVSVSRVSQTSMFGDVYVYNGAEVSNIIQKSSYSFVNVYILDGAKVENIDFDKKGSITLSGNVTVNNVKLGDNVTLAAGNGFNLNDTMTFELTSVELMMLNNGYSDSRTLIKASGNDISNDILKKIIVKGAKANIEITKDASGNIIAQKLVQKGIFVGGSSANDSNAGTSSKPVQTFAKAKEKFDALTDKTNAKIYVLGTLEVTSNEEWTMTDFQSYPIMRDPLFTGPMVRVSGSDAALTLSNIILDGYRDQRVEAQSPIVEVTGGAKLIIGEGAVLRNNVNNGSYALGGAVYAKEGSTVDLNGGEISNNSAYHGGGILVDGKNTTLTITNGNIINNTASDLNANIETDSGGGGGIAIIRQASAVMNGGTISGNSAGAGGGVIVGGRDYTNVSSMVEGETPEHFVMNKGIVTDNTAYHCGGGIYVQSTTEADIYSGEITKNTSEAHGGYSRFSGGGFYVNGTRPMGDDGTFETGILRLHGTTEITGNSSGSKYKGGGYAGCNTSLTYMYQTDGTAIHGNTIGDAYSGSPSDFFTSTELTPGAGQSMHSTMEYYASGYMYDGTRYDWIDAETGEPVSYSGFMKDGSETHLYTNSALGASAKSADIKITENYGGQNGGGIGNNGTVYFGTPDTTAEIKGTKKLTGRDWTEADSFEITLEEVSTVHEGYEAVPDKIETRTVEVKKPGTGDTAAFNFIPSLILTLIRSRKRVRAKTE